MRRRALSAEAANTSAAGIVEVVRRRGCGVALETGEGDGVQRAQFLDLRGDVSSGGPAGPAERCTSAAAGNDSGRES